MTLKVNAPLDPAFSPLITLYQDYLHDVAASSERKEFIIAVERNRGFRDYFSMPVFPDGVEDARTQYLADRIAKTLLWTHGGWKIEVYGSKNVFKHLRDAYAVGGSRFFDKDFMETVYERAFEVEFIEEKERIAVRRGDSSAVGRHLKGCRIGFDAGGSDRKVSAVIDGEAVYSEEVVWHPKTQTDPSYHYDGIMTAMKTAASHMPRVDAIGVSSAGVYIDNKIMAASLFLKVSKEDFKKHAQTMYIDIAREIGSPLEVANDGDVTALAGAMELNKGNVLGIAMGTSEAGGYVDDSMSILGWLNELAFVPVDAADSAMRDEWSGDIGCGVKYFSQDAVIKLAPAAGIKLDSSLSPAEKLKVVQDEMMRGNPNAAAIFETIGVYFGYAIAYYSLFYTIDHVLIMGRVTSGEGGVLILKKAQEVLDTAFPSLAGRIELHIPDESSRRVGQSVAAASLPEVR